MLCGCDIKRIAVTFNDESAQSCLRAFVLWQCSVFRLLFVTLSDMTQACPICFEATPDRAGFRHDRGGCRDVALRRGMALCGVKGLFQ